MTAGPDFVEIGTDDPQRSSAFFKRVMGWEWVVPDGSDGAGFFTDAQGDRKVGLHQEATPCMVPYLRVADIHKTVEQVKAAGGAVMGEITQADGFGRFATCTDPQGVRFGLHQE